MEIKIKSTEQLLLRIKVIRKLFLKQNQIDLFKRDDGKCKFIYADYSGFVIRYFKNRLLEGEQLNYSYKFSDDENKQ